MSTNIVFLTDAGFIMQTYVALTSLIFNKSKNSKYHVFIVLPDNTDSSCNIFLKLVSDDVEISLIKADTRRYENLHRDEDSVAFLSATKFALLKFALPELFPQLDKILYMDGDVIVQQDLSELYDIDLGSHFLAAAHDTGKMYFKGANAEKYPGYFNSGVMLLNLKLMRQHDKTSELIEVKRRSTGLTLMDQPVLNEVFAGSVLHVDSKWNYLAVNLLRANKKWTIEQLNELTSANYSSKEELKDSAAIIHYASKDKPWKVFNGEWATLWYKYYAMTPWKSERLPWQNAKVSIIIPATDDIQALRSLLLELQQQKLSDIEIIIVIHSQYTHQQSLRDLVKVDARIHIENCSESPDSNACRQAGLRRAIGEYVAFCEVGDGVPSTYYHTLYESANNLGAGVLRSNIKYFGCKAGTQAYEIMKNNDYRSAIYKRDVLAGYTLSSQAGNGDLGMYYEGAFKTEELFNCENAEYKASKYVDSGIVHPLSLLVSKISYLNTVPDNKSSLGELFEDALHLISCATFISQPFENLLFKLILRVLNSVQTWVEGNPQHIPGPLVQEYITTYKSSPAFYITNRLLMPIINSRIEPLELSIHRLTTQVGDTVAKYENLLAATVKLQQQNAMLTSQLDTLSEKIALVNSLSKLKLRYRLVKFKRLLCFGKRRKKYQKEIDLLRNLIRRGRRISVIEHKSC